MPWHPGRASEKVAAEGSGAPAGPGGSGAMPGTGPEAAAVVAGNEVGITGARQCAVPLGSAQLCAGLICGNTEMAWWMCPGHVGEEPLHFSGGEDDTLLC